MSKKGIVQSILIVILVAKIFLGMPAAAQAAYSVSFANADIQITSPSGDGLSFDGRVQVAGKSTLDKLWLCIRGPQKEVLVYPVTVNNGEFTQEIVLRFGSGNYTVWAGNDARTFDGSIRFDVINMANQDNRYLDPSAYVDSENELIIQLAAALVQPEATEQDKLLAVHQWLVENVSYDVKTFTSGVNELQPASQTLLNKTGICRDYAFLTCALFRAMDLPSRVVYGNAIGKNGAEPHAWNEVLINGQWVSLDTTWDAGYLRNGRFVASPSKKYLDPPKELFAKTHQSSEITSY